LLAFAALVFWVSQGFSGADEAKPKGARQPAKEDKPQTVTYDVSDLIYKPGGKSGYESIDGLVKMLVLTLAPATRSEAILIQEVNGRALEIQATKAQHDQVKDVLSVFRRQMDCAVDVQAVLYEIDRPYYDKEIKSKVSRKKEDLGKGLPIPVEEAVLKKLSGKAAASRSNQIRIGDYKEVKIFSLRKAFTYTEKPYSKPRGPQDVLGVGMRGVTVQARAMVSPDRRFVRMKITQQVTDLVGMWKHRAVDLDAEKEVTVETPKLVESSITGTVEVGDGEPILVPVHYLPSEVKAKDRVLVLVVRPVIYIEEEEKERHKGETRIEGLRRLGHQAGTSR
jgi:hypothetical protein